MAALDLVLPPPAALPLAAGLNWRSLIPPAVALDPEPVTETNPLTAFRELLKQSNAHFKELFQQGVPAYELVPARAQFMDEVLQRVWRRFFEVDPPDLTLAAVGGYGRGELHPSSDVDLMILLGERAAAARLGEEWRREARAGLQALVQREPMAEPADLLALAQKVDTELANAVADGFAG